MLSDNYGPVGDDTIIRQARSRAEKIANCAAINEVARLGQAFRPVYLCDGTTPFYTLCHEGRRYAAVFNFENATKTLSLPLQMAAYRSKESRATWKQGRKWRIASRFVLNWAPGMRLYWKF